ncbi:MFS transporter [Oleispirillum naphthae]|uniref:MFS transporter n=1 Tax=Oleispirillum naphthae TaxID=2838853 RepID=UPI003082586A
MSIKLDKSLYKWVVLLACLFVYSTSHLVRWNYSSVTKYLMEDLHIGKPELGVMGAAFFYAYAAVQIPWGLAADKLGARYVIPLATGILGFFLAGFAFSGTYTEALVWRALMGVVSASGYVSINSVLSKWFPLRQRGLAMSIFSGVGGASGEVMSFLLIPVIALFMERGILGQTGWKASTIVMGCVVVLIGIMAAVLLRSDPTTMGLPSVQKAEDIKPDIDYREAAKEATKNPVLWLLSGVLSCYIVACRLGPAWLPLYATEFYIQTKGMPKETAIVAGGVMATLYVLGRCLGSPVVGQVSDMLLKKYAVPRFSIVTVMMVLIVVIFGLFTLPIPSPYVLGLLAFAAGTVFNSFPILNAATAELLSVKTAGYCTAVINTVGQVSGALSLTASGYMAVRYSVKGGAFYTEFLGIWYLGIIAGAIGIVLAGMVIRRESKMLKLRNITGKATA